MLSAITRFLTMVQSSHTVSDHITTLHICTQVPNHETMQPHNEVSVAHFKRGQERSAASLNTSKVLWASQKGKQWVRNGKRRVYFYFRSHWTGKHLLSVILKYFHCNGASLFTNTVGELFPARENLMTHNSSKGGYHIQWAIVLDSPWHSSFLHSPLILPWHPPCFTARKHLLP